MSANDTNEAHSRDAALRDEKYIEAVKANDHDTAADLLLAAAQEEGFNLVVWRGEGTPGEIFDFSGRVEPGIFTTTQKEFASAYARHGEPRKFFVKADKVLDLQNPSLDGIRWIQAWGENYDEWTDRYSGEPTTAYDSLMGGGLFDYEGDWSSRRWRDLQRTAKNEGFSVLIAPDSDRNTNEPISTIVLKEENIKLADAVLLNDSGEPIPPSKRFLPTKDLRGDPSPTTTIALAGKSTHSQTTKPGHLCLQSPP